MSFAATPLQVPEGVSVIDMDITAALETAAYIARGRRSPPKPRPRPKPRRPPCRSCANSTSLLAGGEVQARRTGPLHRRRASSRAKACPQRIVEKIYAGDRVSDLLNEASDRTLLVTNLMSLQMIRVAELMDVPGDLLRERRLARTRDRRPRPTAPAPRSWSRRSACSRPAASSTSPSRPLRRPPSRRGSERRRGARRLRHRGRRLQRGGRRVARHQGRTSSRSAPRSDAIRRAMIAAYEAEMNVVIHAHRGRLEASLRRAPPRGRRGRRGARHRRPGAGAHAGLVHGLAPKRAPWASAPAWACPTSAATPTSSPSKARSARAPRCASPCCCSPSARSRHARPRRWPSSPSCAATAGAA